MVLPNFYIHSSTMDYCFGPKHPLKPERMRRTLALLAALGFEEPLVPDDCDESELLRVHRPEYVEAVARLSQECKSPSFRATDSDRAFGFGSMDNPPFPEMHRISLGYVSATVAAAKQVAQGAPLAFAIGGGLHHAMADRASGFCIYNDPAIACSILRESFDRVAYVDIDVHHGDGVQAIWLDDPNVLTASIHEDGRTLFPGTGGVHEVGASFSSVNVPVAAKTSYDVWLEAFRGGILPALMVFEPQAIVLQLGTDIHFADPLGHILGTQDVWLEAVREVMRLGVPIVAVGGGGYNLDTVPRMWVSACLELAGIAYSDELPEPMATEWQARTFSDQERPVAGNGREQAKQVLMAIERDVLPYVPRVS